MPIQLRPRPARGRSRHARHSRLASPALLGILALAVAGCGATTTPGGALRPSPTRTEQPGPPGGGLAVRPCPGGAASAAETANGAIILTESTPAAATPALQPEHEASAHVGDRIQIRLTTSVHWQLREATGGVSPLAPQGGADAALGVCFWNFKAAAAGDATISFTGTAICDTGGPCPLWARDETFVVHIV